MGGPPYKSKGCNTCRRRKVKCDEAKPKCVRCLKNGHLCEGYQKNHVFVLDTNVAKATEALLRRPRTPKLDITKDRPSRLPSTELYLPWFDNNPSVRTQFVAGFISHFAPSSTVLDSKTGKAVRLQDTFPAFVGSSPILDKAVTAMSCAFLAKHRKDFQLLSYSTRLYGEALKTVHSRIANSSRCGPDELFATVIFQLYELINSSPLGFKAWIAHVQGSNAILAQYDGNGSPSVFEYIYFRQLKFTTICNAIGMRRSAYSYNPFWRKQTPENPWRQPIDEILDSLMKCSELIEQTDHLIQSGDSNKQSDQEFGDKLLDRCFSLRDELDLGLSEMQGRLGVPWSSPAQFSFCLDDSISQGLFSDAIEYPSLSCAESHLLYWNIFILLYPLIDQLLIFLVCSRGRKSFILWDIPASNLTDSYATWSADLPEDPTSVAEHYADLVCRSAKFLIQPKTKGTGAQTLLGPFSQATQFYRTIGATEKHRWCQAVFMQLPKLGFGIAPFLKDMIWPK